MNSQRDSSVAVSDPAGGPPGGVNTVPPEIADTVVLEVEDLVKHFNSGGGVLRRSRRPVQAVNGVSFSLRRGETLSLVGESGCGKSTTARLVAGLHRADRGVVRFLGHDLVGGDDRAWRTARRDMQMVFQDPSGSLNPQMSIHSIVAEGLRIHRACSRQDERARVAELLDLVGLRVGDAARRFPYQLSGGQRQRVGIARALALEPQLVLLDEPLSALDVSVQAQILQLLGSLQQRLQLSYLFISHDLGVVRQISDHVCVMYLGRIIESGTPAHIFESPQHPYTQALLSAIPVADPARRRDREVIVLEGDPPSPADPPSGCAFRTRCWKTQPECAAQVPPLEVKNDPGHRTACLFPELEAPARTSGNGLGR